MTNKTMKTILMITLPVIALMLTVITGILVFFSVTGFNGFVKEPEYTASGAICFVVNDDDDDLTTDCWNENLMLTCKEILRTRTFLNEISAEIGGEYTWDEIRDMTEIEQIEHTELLKISVTGKDAEDVYAIAISFMEKTPEKIESVLMDVDVVIISEPLMPDKAR